MAFPVCENPPTYRIEFTEDGHAIAESGSPAIQFKSVYVVEDNVITRAFGSTLPPELADLVDIALAVYIADRLARRRPYRADRSLLHWTRRFDLRIPVRDPRRWRDTELYRQLRDVLWFLTEDDWHVRFAERRGGRHVSESQQALFRLPPEAPVVAALFSGGLDSLAGVFCELASRPTGSIVLFSASTNDRIKAKQRALVRSVRNCSTREIVSVIVPITLSRGGRRYSDDERTQRSRGFLFWVLGAVTALMAGANRLASYENGIGAINLPYTPVQLGTHSTRSTHPTALMRLGALITLATGKEFILRTPFLYMTKAQLCELAAKKGLGLQIRETVSCDGFPQRLPGKPQCGACSSCLLRRQALCAAGLDHFDAVEDYLYDIVSPGPTISRDTFRPMRMMLGQVESLRRALGRVDQWPGLMRQYPQLWEVAVTLQSLGEDSESIRQGLIDLYRRYCDEWERFPVKSAPAHGLLGRR